MKSIFLILSISLSLFACSYEKTIENTEFEKIEHSDTLVSRKIINYGKSSTSSYFVIVKNDTSKFNLKVKEHQDNERILMRLQFDGNKTKTYNQVLDEITIILKQVSKDFNLDSLNSFQVGKLSKTGDMAISLTQQYYTEFGKTERVGIEEYDRLFELMLNSKLTKDIDILFKPYSLSVNKVFIEKARFVNKERFLKHNKISKETVGLDKILEGFVWVRLKND